MARKYVTAASAATISAAGAKKLLITVNTALTGTITVADSSGTIAVITNPTVGSFYQYWDLTGPVTVTPSATCDITVNTSSSLGGQ
jgi:hypothetical protein